MSNIQPKEEKKNPLARLVLFTAKLKESLSQSTEHRESDYPLSLSACASPPPPCDFGASEQQTRLRQLRPA